MQLLGRHREMQRCAHNQIRFTYRLAAAVGPTAPVEEGQSCAPDESLDLFLIGQPFEEIGFGAIKGRQTSLRPGDIYNGRCVAQVAQAILSLSNKQLHFGI